MTRRGVCGHLTTISTTTALIVLFCFIVLRTTIISEHVKHTCPVLRTSSYIQTQHILLKLALIGVLKTAFLDGPFGC